MKKLVAGGVLIAVAVVAWLLWTHHGHAAEHAASSGSGAAVLSPHERAKAAVPASVAGRVTNKESGAGIAGAVVALESGGIMGNELGKGLPTVTAITDASGAWSAPSVAPGDYIINAAAPGFVPAALPKVAIGSGEQKAGVAIALAPGGTLVKGLVSDIGGGPIEGARVAFALDDRFDFETSAFTALTAKDGTYQISLGDGEYNASASHDDYVKKQHEQIEVAGKPVTADFVLTPGGGIRGQIIARDTGKPVPFALVHAALQHGRFDGGGAPNTTADTDGKFAVRSLHPGVIAISAFGRGYATVAPTTVELGIGEQVENVRVLVDRAYTISGTIVKKGTKTGVSKIQLGVFSMSQGAQVMAADPSDELGRFAIDGVRPGSYMMFAIGEGQVPNVGQQVKVVDKDINDVVIEVEGGVTIAGRVNPPQEAAMTIEMAAPVGITNLFEAVKTMMVHGDADAKTGEFALHNVPAGAFKIVARAKEGPVGKLPIIVADADQKGVVVALEARAAVSGKVLDTTGAPVAGARINTRRTDDGDHDQNNGFTMNGGPRGTKSAADGTFRVVGLEAGTYDLHASNEDDFFEDEIDMIKDKKSDKKKVEVTLALGEDKSGFILTVEARNGVIKGQVVGSDKQPASDAWVTAKRVPQRTTTDTSDSTESNSEWWSSSEPVLTGADGKFTITKLRQGTYQVVADGPHGGSRAEKKGVKPGDTITIELAPLGTLSGHVTSGGAPVTSYTIDCNGPGSADRSVSAADGAYSIEHLAPGSYSCSVKCDAGTASGKIDVPPGAVTLDFTLVGWASVTGTVVSMFDHKPVPNILAMAGEDNDAGMADIIAGNGPKSDATGRFVVPKVAAGSRTVMLMAAEGGFKPLATKQFTAVDGQRIDVGPIEVVPPRVGDAGTLGMVSEPTGVTEAKDLAKTTTLTVDQVKPGGPAATAGVLVGDSITSIDGRNIADLGAMAALNYLSSGTIGIGVTVELGIDRGGTKSQISVTSVKW